MAFEWRDYQIEDQQFLRDVPYAALFWEQGLGKTAEVVEHANQTNPDLILVLTPAMCRSVWQSPDPSLSDVVALSKAEPSIYAYNQPSNHRIRHNNGPVYVIASIESIALNKHYDGLKAILKEFGKNPDLCVIDESSFIRSPKAERTHAAIKLAHLAKRRIVLNGTPTSKNEMDLWAQYEALNPNILGYRNYFHFRANHATMGGYKSREVVKIINREKIYERTAPYTRRRLKKDHLKSLPGKLMLPPREVELKTTTWKLYKQMREDAVIFLESPEGRSSLAQSGGVVALRLAQLTSGFVGGLFDELSNAQTGVQEVSSEKTDAIISDLTESGEDYPIIWCRFQPEIARLVKRLCALQWRTYEIHGRATERQKNDAKIAFRHRDETRSHCCLVGHPAAASLGITLVAAESSHYLSQDFNFINRSQSEDRTHRGGQAGICTYRDYVCVGPNGQQTIDHKVRKVLNERQDIASFSSEQWIKMLLEE